MAPEEELWRKRLLEEEVTPPDSVWQGIEAALDRPKRRGIFFWLSRIGGGIAAVLALISLGVWLPTALTPTAPLTSLPARPDKAVIPVNSPTRSVAQASVKSLPVVVSSVELTTFLPVISSYRSQDERLVVDLFSSEPAPATRSWVEVNPLPMREFAWYGSRFQWNRPRLIVPVTSSEMQEEEEANSSSQGKYLAFQTSVAPFQPGVQWPGLTQAAFAAVRATLQEDGPLFTTSGNRSPLPIEKIDQPGIASVYDPNSFQPEQTFKTGWAWQGSASVGKFFTEHWGMEVGLRYVQGAHSTHSNVFSWNPHTAAAQTFFESTILTQPSSQASILTSRETLQTRYHLISLPVQAVYRRPLGEHWEVMVTGGMTMDKLLLNQWSWGESDSEQQYRPSNSSFRPITASALGGVRMGRQLGPRWQATAGVFGQQSLGSWVSNDEVRMKPQQVGGQVGLTYRWP